MGPTEELIWILDENASSPPMREDCTYTYGRRGARFWLPLGSRAWSKDSHEGNLYWKVISRKWNGIQGGTKEGRRKDSWIGLAPWIGNWSSILPTTLGNPQNTLPNCPPEEWKKKNLTTSSRPLLQVYLMGCKLPQNSKLCLQKWAPSMSQRNPHTESQRSWMPTKGLSVYTVR